MIQMLMSCSSEWTLQRSLPWSLHGNKFVNLSLERIRKVMSNFSRTGNFSVEDVLYIKNASEVKQIFFADVQ